MAQDRFHPAGTSSQLRRTHHLKLAVEHVVDIKRHVVTVKFRKKLTVKDIQRYSALLRSNAEFHPNFSEIVDLTDVEEFELQADDFLKIADEVDPFSTESKRAFVAQTSAQNYAARMHKLLRAQRTLEIFRTVKEAERWIFR